MPAKGRRSASKRAKSVSASARAQTVFPVGRLNRLMRKGRYGARLSGSSGAFMAGVLEYLALEICELAGMVCEKHKKKQITPKHINLAIRNDDDLNKLMCEVTIAAGGRLPFIAPQLMKKGKGGADASQPL